jgi:hypothetical protein
MKQLTTSVKMIRPLAGLFPPLGMSARSLERAFMVAAAFLPVFVSFPARALSFNLTCRNAFEATVNCSDPSAFNQTAFNGFLGAAQRWSNLFADPITVNLSIGFNPLGPNILGQASSTTQLTSYGQLRSALNNDKTSADDTTAFNSLPTTPDVDLLINRTRNSPNGIGSSTPYLDNDADANNTIFDINTANLKALGLLGATSTADVTITFSRDFAFDFDPGNGITAGQFDFVGIATHEIGHGLGFISGVDVLDENSTSSFFRDDQFTFLNTLDLYRYSAASVAQGPGVIDWTADNRTKFFSIDGGTTSLGTFSTGANFGDGSQASHWKDNLGLGIMDPTFDFGELGIIKPLDVRAFDVIGYDLASQVAVPGPLPARARAGGGLRLEPAAEKAHPAVQGQISQPTGLSPAPSAPATGSPPAAQHWPRSGRPIHRVAARPRGKSDASPPASVPITCKGSGAPVIGPGLKRLADLAMMAASPPQPDGRSTATAFPAQPAPPAHPRAGGGPDAQPERARTARR